LLQVLVMVGLCSVAWAQNPEQIQAERTAQREALARSIQAFVDGYEVDRLDLQGPLRSAAGLQPPYARLAFRAGLLGGKDGGSLTHQQALEKLLVQAERNVDEAVGDAILSVASVGFERSLLDRESRMLREIGHVTLLRVDDEAVWFLLMRVAGGLADGEQPQERGDGQSGSVLRMDPARRVAAMRLLAQRNRPVFRATIERALSDFDPRVRLAAAESLGLQRSRESFPLLVRAMGVERHPVVSQAVVHAVLAILVRYGRELHNSQIETALSAATRMLGQSGWRTDMELLDLIERYPGKSVIPYLIDTMGRAAAPEDALVELVNPNARPRLRNRAHELLRGMTGAILPADDAVAWREFWQQEQANIVVPRKLAKDRQQGSTQSTFFGIPVTGNEIAFLIDTSGSMNAELVTVPVTGPRRSKAATTRLGAAKEQLLLAVQSMEKASRYHVITFAGEARVMSRKAVPPSSDATRQLTGLLARMHPDGGTNLYDGLVQALSMDELYYGTDREGGIDELFVLSDGEPTSGAITDRDQLLQLVREANKYLKIRIHTVFTGNGSGADLLEKLAEENDGVFVRR
jgi:hypothetical protein